MLLGVGPEHQHCMPLNGPCSLRQWISLWGPFLKLTKIIKYGVLRDSKERQAYPAKAYWPQLLLNFQDEGRDKEILRGNWTQFRTYGQSRCSSGLRIKFIPFLPSIITDYDFDHTFLNWPSISIYITLSSLFLFIELIVCDVIMCLLLLYFTNCKLQEGRSFVFHLHCSSSSAHSSAWYLVGAQ